MTTEHIWDLHKDFPIIHLPNVLNNVFRKYFDFRLFFCSATVKVFIKAFPCWDNLFRDAWIHATGPHLLIFGSRRSNLSFLWGKSSVLCWHDHDWSWEQEAEEQRITYWTMAVSRDWQLWTGRELLVLSAMIFLEQMFIFKIKKVQRNKLFGIVIFGIWLKMNQNELLNCSPLSGTKSYDN